MDKVSFFCADYRDGRVHIGGKSYPAGTFAMNLLNQYYENDTAARIAVFKQYNWAVIQKLEQGYINPSDFVKFREEISNILKTLPKLKPFSMLDTDKEHNRIAELFTESNAYFILVYLRQKAAAVQKDNDELVLDLVPNNYDKDLFKQAAELLNDVITTLTFYNNLSVDMRKAFEGLTKFVSRIDEAERFDEPHLLPIAIEIFGQVPFPIKTEYVAIPKTSRSKELVTARRLYLKVITVSLLQISLRGYTAGIIQDNATSAKSTFLCSLPQGRNIARDMLLSRSKAKPLPAENMQQELIAVSMQRTIRLSVFIKIVALLFVWKRREER